MPFPSMTSTVCLPMHDAVASLTNNPANGQSAYRPFSSFSTDEMLARMYASDSTADGQFLTGVISTGIYCLPSCPARKPKRENVVFFATEEEASAAGLRPCKRCRPDRFYAGVDPDHDRIADAIAHARRDPSSVPDVPALADRVGVGLSKLHTLFQRHLHTTPGELLHEIRMNEAQRILAASGASATAVAFTVGYESVSAFYQRFKRATGLTPGGYANLGDKPGAPFVLELPPGFRKTVPLRMLRRDAESPLEKGDETRAAKAIHLGGCAAVLEIEIRGRHARCSVEGLSQVTPCDARSAHAVAVNLLGLGSEPARFETAAKGTMLEASVRRNAGLRIPRTADPWEAIVWAILGQQVSLQVCFMLRRNLVKHCGERACTMTAHPTVAQVSELEPADLRALQFSVSKAEFLIGIARALVTAQFDLELLRSGTATAANDALLSLRGIGPWSAGYILMRGFGFRDAIPVGDAGLAHAIQLISNMSHRPSPAEQFSALVPFAPDRSLAVFHLWEYRSQERAGL